MVDQTEASEISDNNFVLENIVNRIFISDSENEEEELSTMSNRNESLYLFIVNGMFIVIDLLWMILWTKRPICHYD